MITIAKQLPQYTLEEIMAWSIIKTSAVLWALGEYAKAQKEAGKDSQYR